METMVSILCATYKQEKYIRETLESFVQQKTTFPFEVLVNDDASPDSTPQIVKEYADKYPNIIKPTFQTENQYSQHISIVRDILLPKATGKYITICEGDDFLVDPLKLQKQVDYMESHPECSLTIHNSKEINEDGSLNRNRMIVKKSRNISTERLILGHGGFCATNSIMGRRKDFLNRPQYFDIATLDYTWQMHLSSLGKTYCFSDIMSAYRLNAIGSFTVRQQSVPKEKIIDDARTIIHLLDAFDEQTDKRFHWAVKLHIFLFQLCTWWDKKVFVRG